MVYKSVVIDDHYTSLVDDNQIQYTMYISLLTDEKHLQGGVVMVYFI